MNFKHHKTLTGEKWSEFPFYKQIIMIANELNRARNWIIKKDFEEVKNCYERAFELIDLTVSVLVSPAPVYRVRVSLSLRRELLRFRGILAGVYVNKQNNIEMNQKLINVLLSLNKDSYNLLVRE